MTDRVVINAFPSGRGQKANDQLTKTGRCTHGSQNHLGLHPTTLCMLNKSAHHDSSVLADKRPNGLCSHRAPERCQTYASPGTASRCRRERLSAAGGLPAHVSPGPAGLRHGFWRQGLSHCRDKLCLILPPLPAPLPLQPSPFPICWKAVNGGETAENLHGNYRGFMSPRNPVGSWAACRALAAS